MLNLLRILLCVIILMPAAPAGADELVRAINALTAPPCCAAMARHMDQDARAGCSCPLRSQCQWTPTTVTQAPDLLTPSQPRPQAPALTGLATPHEVSLHSSDQTTWSRILDKPPGPQSRAGTILLI